MKLSFPVALFCATSVVCLIASPARKPQQSQKSGNILTEHQIKNYVQNIVESLFAGQDSQGQKSICNNITKKLVEKTVWEKSYNLPVERTTQEVYQKTLGGIVDYVERKSFDLAKIESGKYDTSVQISHLVRNELERIVTTAGTFDEGALKNFIGRDLEYKVRNLCYHYYSPQKVIKRYDEKRCRICFNHYSSSLPWIYIIPCGHDICTQCAEAYFIFQNNQLCPVCKQPVDIYQIRESIYQPSAPWY